MAGATKIEVLNDGVPVENATLLVGTLLGTREKTNAQGRINFDLPVVDWRGLVDILVETQAGTKALVHMELKEGKVNTIELRNMTPNPA